MQEGQFNQLKAASVLNEILQERVNQEKKWGQQNHTAPNWLMILGEEVGEANKAALETYFYNHGPRPAGSEDKSYAEYRTELVQVAAVACAMIESLDRNNK